VTALQSDLEKRGQKVEGATFTYEEEVEEEEEEEEEGGAGGGEEGVGVDGGAGADGAAAAGEVGLYKLNPVDTHSA
jgi:hypothetical protein